MVPIHDRMPVIIPPDRFEAWLRSDAGAESFFEPFPAKQMEAYAVGTRVNSPRNDDASLIHPGPRSSEGDPPSRRPPASPPTEPGLFG